MSNSCNTMDYSLPGSFAHGFVAISFFRGSSQPRTRTRVSHIAGGFFTNWAMRGFPSDILSHLSPSLGLSFFICKKGLLLHLHKVTEILWISSDQTVCVCERERERETSGDRKSRRERACEREQEKTLQSVTSYANTKYFLESWHYCLSFGKAGDSGGYNLVFSSQGSQSLAEILPMLSSCPGTPTVQMRGERQR